ncbi:MAG TPA: hypothetical protein VG815_15855, partial [Chloroflexota bacterium]|nr:hypothetical protein [Chloroflexota bacterium]
FGQADSMFPNGIALGPDGNVWSGTGDLQNQTYLPIARLGLVGAAAKVRPEALLSTKAFAFGSEKTSANLTLYATMTDPGTQDLLTGSMALTGSGASAFSITYTCAGHTVTPSYLTPPSKFSPSCLVGIEFHPAQIRAYAATLNIYTDASVSPVAVSLSGAGTKP